ncbi:FimV/HubP family polar landmark protein [Marinobacter zhejiangensis]|uniref:Pilus assembly protein FimV n=1 Tax=Marinobacter zhejiangensis TaxID=488535 RepID=A0A1I4RTK1_9GAMM|nr:FimV/HubP family polar landmark protein [Marinobacter zhejiangensis]SFM55459.1 pilus assembly protein FimV [Marinobacter zhejiangensis]
MKVRKLAVALALAGGLGSGVAQALGLGEIELQSYLNEPLEADIGLTRSGGVSPSEVFVNLASDEAYRQVGIDRSYFLNRLKFNVATSRDGSLVVNVSTTEPVREPYLNFLVEVTWPSGRLMREYSLLIDPPVYAEDSGITQQVQAPSVTAAPAPTQAPQQTTAPASRPQTTSTTAASGSAPGTFGPTGPADTLWGIASAVKPDSSVSNQQVMLAIQDLNPDAFIGGNINRLKRGQVLRVPTLEQIQARSAAQATREVSLQNQALSTSTRAVDAREESLVADSGSQQPAASVEPAGDELKLVVTETGSESADNDAGSAGGENQMSGGVDSGSSVAMEELDSTRRENQELSGRVEDLQSQVETLQRLLELKNSQLAEYEQSLAADATEGEPAGSVVDPSVVAAGEALDAGEPVMGEGDDAETAGAGVESEEGADLVAEGESGVAQDAAEPAVEGAEEAEFAGEGGELSDEASLTAPGVEGMSDADTAEAEQVEAQPDNEVVAAETGVAPAPTAQEKPRPVVAAPAPAEAENKDFPQNIIDAIVGNPLYQIALGGGLVLFLLLMLLVARRNANKEKAFHDTLNDESEGDDAPVELAAEGQDEGEAGNDPLAEADTYIAYGRLDQAAQALESAISNEPSRTDLRLKLLGVYADAEDRNSFEKQYGELEALEDDAAISEAAALRSRLEEAEAAPSIDELESQLMSDSFSVSSESEEVLADNGADESSESDLEFGDLDFTSDEESEKPAAEGAESPVSENDLSFELDETVADTAEEVSADAPIEFDLSDLELDADASGEDDALAGLEDETTAVSSLEDDGLSLDFDLEGVAGDEGVVEEEVTDVDLDLGELEVDMEQELTDTAEETVDLEDDFASLDLGEETLEEESVSSEMLDESFLDELDAELDKVAGGEDQLPASEPDALEDLELDITDEDLALMGEVASTSGDRAEDEDLPIAGDELGFDEALGESGEFDIDVPVADEAVSEDATSFSGASTEQTAQPSSADSIAGIDEAALGDDDDFDFLAGTDEAATKLDLARAYIEMGDSDGARDILEEVAIEGSDEQKVEAQDLLKSLS